MDVRRLAAALLVFASQVLGGLVVLCDDGGAQHLELRAGCCEPEEPERSDACALDDDCATCSDTALEALAPCVEPAKPAWDAQLRAPRAVDLVVLDLAPRARVARDAPARLEGGTERLRSVVLLR